MATAAALIFTLVAAGAVAFQLGLALGAPWGSYAMAGRHPGAFPPRLRVAAAVQAALLAFLAIVVLSDAGVALPSIAQAAPWLIWAPVVFSAVSLVLNGITPSAGERRIWVPVALVMLASSLVVAID
ncbi:MAG TPA: hypothetical protein VFY18_02580 [Candidatus Limnocylindrales bacterium]|nr:hypothetical protein [Candidatus Limnocylindrales bacterium]